MIRTVELLNPSRFRLNHPCCHHLQMHLILHLEGSSHVSEAQVFDWQWGEWREWDVFLMRFFKPIRGITKFHDFRVENTEPGNVYMKESVHEVEQVFCILKEGVSVEEMINADLPLQLQQGGISNQRRCKGITPCMTVCSLPSLTTKYSIICLYMVLYYDERRTTKLRT